MYNLLEYFNKYKKSIFYLNIILCCAIILVMVYSIYNNYVSFRYGKYAILAIISLGLFSYFFTYQLGENDEKKD